MEITAHFVKEYELLVQQNWRKVVNFFFIVCSLNLSILEHQDVMEYNAFGAPSIEQNRH